MANMNIGERTAQERPELGHARHSRLFQTRGRWTLLITNAILVAIAVAVSIATIAALDSWASWIVLGAIVMTTIGAMIALHTRMN